MTIADGPSLSAIFSILSISLVCTCVYICILYSYADVPLPPPLSQTTRDKYAGWASTAYRYFASPPYSNERALARSVYLCFPYHFVIIDNIVKAFCRKQWAITTALLCILRLSFLVTRRVSPLLTSPTVEPLGRLGWIYTLHASIARNSRSCRLLIFHFDTDVY